DAVGNIDATPASRTWTVDTIAPETTISSGPSGAVNSRSASFAFSSSEAGSTFACSLDGSAYASCTSPQPYSGLPDGSHTVAVRAADAAGNTEPTPPTQTWTVDTAAPETVINTGPQGTATINSASFAFS